MSPRRRVPQDPRRSTRPRADPAASTSVGDPGASTSGVDAGASSSAPPPGPPPADQLLHLRESELRGVQPEVHKAKMGRSEEVDQRLVILGLIHFTELGHMPLDRSLIQGLAMFWRPETHTFHFSRVCEMTVDLEDVAFILGLPTTGLLVTGRADYDDVLLLADLALPRDTPMDDVLDCFKEKTKE
ncbi:hypothetical protein LUZ63_002226 [Rhynchospora breviuscula]|uniref:Aminotransferase-like plant mobile domain-containing protein n=1 Tax=Rhynchospora breviuscula TaxID=2022672 RepID=A0A9Q0HXT1_9POAL|nr:hypothetical protein LUZ63_002226 [Rhynchospora breviuscula]